MNARFNHSTLTPHRLLIALFVCVLTGCWEEIHYTPPAAESAAPNTAPTNEPASPVASSEEPDANASNFADDVADSLATPPPEPAPPVDRYGETAPAVAEEPSNSGETAADFGELSRAAVGEPVTAPVVSPPSPRPAADPARSTRRMAWLLGSKLSLAALANERGAAAEKVAAWSNESQALAKLLSTTAADLPPRPSTAAAAQSAGQAIDYLFAQGQVIGRDLAKGHGDDHAALFELAVKSNILLVLYRPRAPVVEALAAAIEQAGQRAKLPAETWQPLLKMLNDGAPQAKVREAVFQLHADVDQYLSTVQP